MLIIDKNKDYYDYLTKVYGVDTQIVYDRRGSKILTNEVLYDKATFNTYDYYSSMNIHFILEVGLTQYLFELSDYKKVPTNPIFYSSDKYIAETIKLLHIFRENKHFLTKEISLVPVNIAYHYSWKQHKDIINSFTYFKESINKIYLDKIIENPILTNTKIPSFVPELDIWKELNNYIGSTKNDKDINIKLTDIDRAINHGFDKKTSFRNPIKW